MDKQNCEHKNWKRTGLWDGVKKAGGSPMGGPVIKCADCGLERYISYEEWAKIEKESDFDFRRANKK